MDVQTYSDQDLAKIAGVQLLDEPRDLSAYSDEELASVAGRGFAQTPQEARNKRMAAYRPSILTQVLMNTPAGNGAGIAGGLNILGKLAEDYFGGRSDEAGNRAESFPVTSIRRTIERTGQVLESTGGLLSSMLRLPEAAISSLSPESEGGTDEFARGLDPRANITAYPSLVSQLIKEGASAVVGRDVTTENDPMVRPLTNILSTLLYGNANPYAPSAQESEALGAEQFHEAPGNLIMTPLIAEGTFKTIPGKFRSVPRSILARQLEGDLGGASMLDRVGNAKETTAEVVPAEKSVSTSLDASRSQSAPVTTPSGPVLDLADGVEPQVAEIASRAIVRDPKLYDELLQLGHDPKTIAKMTPEEVAYYVSGGRIDYRKQGFVPPEAAKSAEGEGAVDSGAGGANAPANTARVAKNDGAGTDVAVAKTAEEMAAAVADRIEQAKSQATERGVPTDTIEKLAAADPHAEAELFNAQSDPVTAAKIANRAARDADVWEFLSGDVPAEPAPESHPVAKGTAGKRQREIATPSTPRDDRLVKGVAKKGKGIPEAKAGEVGVYPPAGKGHVFKLTEQNQPIIEALSETAGRSTGTGKAGAAKLAQNAPWWDGKGYNMSALRVVFGKVEKGEPLSAPQTTMIKSALKDYLSWRKKNIDALKDGPSNGVKETELSGAKKAAIAAGMASPVVVAAVISAMPGDDDQSKAASIISGSGEGLLSAALVGAAFGMVAFGKEGKPAGKGKSLVDRVARQERLVEKAMRKRRLDREAKLKSGRAKAQAAPPGYLIESGPDQIATDAYEMARDGALADRELHGNVQRFPELVQQASLGSVKDIKPLAIAFQDMYRSFEQVFGKKGTEQVMRPFDEAKGRFVDDFTVRLDRLEKEVVKGLGIKKGSRLSEAVQRFGEGEWTSVEVVRRFGIEKAERVKVAERWFRKTYDELIAEVNTSLQKIYPTSWQEHQIPYRQDYFHHFREMQGDLAGIFNALKTQAQIDPQLVPISEVAKPKSTWWGAMQRRVGLATEYDAVGGYLHYLPSAMYKLHIDPQLDVFNHLVRDLAVGTGRGFELYNEATNLVVAKVGDLKKAQEIAKRYKDPIRIDETTGKRPINNFILQLTHWTQDLAHKTNFIDRPVQTVVGRKTIRVLSIINQRIARNAILMNAASTLVQTANIPMAIGETKHYAFLGMGRTMDMARTGDIGVQRRSVFLKERYIGNRLRRFDSSLLEQPVRAAGAIMSRADELATRFIWNSFYEKALHTAERDPIRYADVWTRKMVAGRGTGEIPLAHQSLTGRLIMPFQIEVGNQWLAMKEMGQRRAFGSMVSAMIAANVMNQGFQEVLGRRVLFDPINALYDIWKISRVRNMKVRMKMLKAVGRGAGEILSNLPLGQTMAAMAVKSDVAPQIFGVQDPSRFGVFGSPILSTVQQTVSQGYNFAKGNGPVPLNWAYSVVPPFGGAQLRRGVEGVRSVASGRSRSAAGKYQFSIDDSPVNYLRAALFGKYATPEGKKYIQRREQKVIESGK